MHNSGDAPVRQPRGLKRFFVRYAAGTLVAAQNLTDRRYIAFDKILKVVPLLPNEPQSYYR